MKSILKCPLFIALISCCRVSSFSSPFSNLWTVSKTFSNGGFEGEVKVPVRSTAASGWKLTLIFDKPVKGLKIWKGVIDDVSPDFTQYDIINQPWNSYLREGTKFEFKILGHSVGGLPSLKIGFQGNVIGEAEDDFSSSGEGSGSGIQSDLWVDYDQVLKLSLEFFEAKRSGRLSSDNRIPWKSDSALYDGGAEGHDLTGGYYVGGDYVKFGFPMAFAMTQLAWGILEARSSYESAGESTNLLKALKWGSDYFLKAHVKENEFFGMVGDPGIDHGHWEGGHNVKWRRPAFKLTAEDPGSDLVGETAASLAATSIIFQDIEPSYAEHLRNEALYLYNFADTYRARYDAFSIPGAKDYYPSTEYGDELVWGGIWLFKATGNQEYLDKAVSKYDEFRLATHPIRTGFDYDNKVLGIQISLTELTGEYERYMTPVLEFCDKWSSRSAPLTSDGLLHNKRTKSTISFSANTAFICALAAKFVQKPKRAEAYRAMADTLISKVLGKGSKTGYMVGFGERYPTSLHDRDSSCPPSPNPCGWGFFNSPSPNANMLVGAIVGGPDKKGRFEDTRKNFVGNQPNLLYNSAFQSAVALMSSYHVEANGRSYVPSALDDIRSAVFNGENLAAFDACSSTPCENNGICHQEGKFNYNCECPPDVYGRNCDYRLKPSIKWVNKWISGAQMEIVLPNQRPHGPWQLRIVFPKGCPLQEVDVWNACINVLESSREQGGILMQQVGWHKSMKFIGMKFDMGQPDLDHCFQGENYDFMFIQRESASLANKSPDHCPRKLPHAYEGSGSGFSGDYLDNPDTQSENPGSQPLTPAPGVTHQPPTQVPDLEEGEISIGPPEMLEWISKWPFGGQGHIHVADLRPNDKGDWYLTVNIPSRCPMKSIKFWGACTVRNLNNPENGEYVLEQIDWQIHQSFIGFAAHFYRGAGDPDACYDNHLFEFKFTVNRVSFNRDVNTCPADFHDLPLQTEGVRTGSSPLHDHPQVPGPTIIPIRISELLTKPIPSIDDLAAEEIRMQTARISWTPISNEDIKEIEVTIEPFISPTVETDEEFIKAYRKHFFVPAVQAFQIVNDLVPGMKYQVSGRALGSNERLGSTTTLYFTVKPEGVQNVHVNSLDGVTIHVTWKEPIGMHNEYKIAYVPDGNKGQPQSPFFMAGNKTETRITGLSTGSDYLITILTLSGDSVSDGVHVHGKTGSYPNPISVTSYPTFVLIVDRCSELTCGLNEFCENGISGPRCVCMSGYGGQVCSDIDECTEGAEHCHENAHCKNSVGSFSCVCKDGYTGNGVFCYDVNECSLQDSICSGSCINTEGSFFCACPVGYTGELDNCIDIDECSSNSYNCSDDLICNNNAGSYSCICEAGFTLGDSLCTDIDECVSNSYKCPLLTRCANTIGSYKCVCIKGYQKVDDDCVDVNECSLPHHNCPTNSACHNIVGDYECNCLEGFQLLGSVCQDRNECETENICSSNATCKNIAGSYSCSCLAGFTGDGIACRELADLLVSTTIDECSLGTHQCDEHAICRDTPGTYECECQRGYKGNGTLCKDFDECSADTKNTLCGAFPNTRCVNTDGGYTCACDDGWTSSTGGCIDIDECSSGNGNCSTNARCVNVEGSYSCVCGVGYTGDGKTCVAD